MRLWPSKPSKVKIAPSILSADFGNLCRDCRRAVRAGADLLHLDVMDGHFVPNITIGPVVVRSVASCVDVPLDVHLMIEKPQDYCEAFVEAGASMVSFHAEACEDVGGLISRIKALDDVKAGLAINPETGIDTVMPHLEVLDYVLIMSVNPGFPGQSFITDTLEKIGALRAELTKRELPVEIEVDGGITVANASDVNKMGADILVAGTAVFGASNITEAVKALRRIASL